MKRIFKNLRSERGASLAEYALLTVLFAVPSIVAVEQVTAGLSQNFEDAAASGVAVDQSDPGSTSTVPNDPTTTVAPATSTTVPTSTTAGPTTTTTTTTTTTPPAATTTTTAPPPTTTVPPTTTTTAAPGEEGNPVDPAPSEQSTTVDTDGGWVTFASDDGEISIGDFALNNKWQGSHSVEDDNSMVVLLWHSRNGKTVTITAWIDDDGYLQTSVI
ncbi:MAG: hypothetical protein QNL12_09270 [Acidimicrobiia bacterium]|nr:hypothetical protein [Acidimicrobiia bacterium]MDX2467492.1 hypothetical protein [Acidimicrobiia bacterium]